MWRWWFTSTTLAATKTISAGGTGLNGGYLILRRFTQLGSAAVNLTLGSSATYVQFGPNSAMGGNVTVTSPGIYLHGCTFSGTSSFTMTGFNNTFGTGGNTFTGAASSPILVQLNSDWEMDCLIHGFPQQTSTTVVQDIYM